MERKFFLMGILNLTPNSFSDGNLYFNKDFALKHFEKLERSGANIIDIGAESTAPGQELITATEEWTRLKLIFESNAISSFKTLGGLISIDTRKAEIAHKALTLGAEIINDVSALSDPEMLEVLKEFPESKIVIMHNYGIPPKKTFKETNFNIIAELEAFFKTKINILEKSNINKNRIILDPGLGFDKNTQENLIIINNLISLKQAFNLPILIGLSRKRFVKDINNLLNNIDIDKTSAVLNAISILNGADIIRTHCLEDFK